MSYGMVVGRIDVALASIEGRIVLTRLNKVVFENLDLDRDLELLCGSNCF